MRNKLLLALGLFVALSGGSAYAQVTQTHEVETTITEVRSITLGGGDISIAIQRSAAGNWVDDNTNTLIANHDLIATQKITVHTDTKTAWTSRYLRINAPTLPALGWTNASVAVGVPALLVNNGAESFPIATPQDFITGLDATTTDGATPGATPALALSYSSRADLAAVVGANDTINVVYTITDQ